MELQTLRTPLPAVLTVKCSFLTLPRSVNDGGFPALGSVIILLS
jgi:hypothetical protein